MAVKGLLFVESKAQRRRGARRRNAFFKKVYRVAKFAYRNRRVAMSAVALGRRLLPLLTAV